MQGNVLIGVPLVFTILAVIAVVLRFYVRCRSKVNLGREDWVMLLAVIIEIVNRALTTLSIYYESKTTPTAEDGLQALKYNYVALPFQVLVSVMARVSIMFLLIRLFGVHVWFKRFLILLVGVICVLSIVFIPIAFCQITPVQRLWDFSLPVEKQWNPHIFLYWACVTQSLYSFSDLVFVLFPVMIIWKLNMPLRQKIGLIILMGLSLFTMAMSILRTVWIVYSYSGNSTLSEYNETAILTLAFLEGDMIIIMGCIPTLRGLMHLDMTVFGISISNLFSRSKSKPSTLAESSSGSGPYHDLEMSTRKLGMVTNDSVEVSTAVFHPVSPSQDVLIEQGEVKRTDDFTVTYEQRGEVGKVETRHQTYDVAVT